MDSLANFKALLAGWFAENGIPDHLQEVLYAKLKDDVFDSGTSFGLAVVDDCDDEADAGDEAAPEGTEAGTGDLAVKEYVLVAQTEVKAGADIWLVDHFWTFLLRNCRSQLEENEHLRSRLAPMLKVSPTHTDAKKDADTLYRHLWKQAYSYRLPSPPGEEQKLYESCWFIHDEVGSSIVRTVCGSGNMRLAPMPVCFPEKGCVFSVMWCVEDMAEGTIATTAATHTAQEQCGAEVVAVLYGDEGDDATERAKRQCVEAWKQHSGKLQAIADASRQPNGVHCARAEHPPPPRQSLPLRFYTDSKAVSEHVADTEWLRQTLLVQEADIMWMAHYAMASCEEFPHARFVSQFPEEGLFTNKRDLARIVQHRLGCPAWFPVAYDGATQLREFVGDYLTRRERLAAEGGGQPTPDAVELRDDDGTNLWITKPVNLARSIDMTVSDNIDCLLKVMENGPKIICKYIANTATLRGRKFDLRFIVAVRSLVTPETPLEAYVYDRFWTRFAVEPYSLADFDVYEKHWTVMNYQNPEKLLQLPYDSFIPELNEAYAQRGCGAEVWQRDVYPQILQMLEEVFRAIPAVPCDHSRFRAIYGVDVMIREVRRTGNGGAAVTSLQPTLLEITYSPDCSRACRYYPSFFNDVFSTLFLGQPVNMTRLGH